MPQGRACIATLHDAAWVDVAADIYAKLAERATITAPEEVNAIFNGDRTVVFEGAQGVLLDESYGFHPHTTWSTTTTANAEAMLSDAGCTHPRCRVGVMRTYATRHGSGPFVTEDPSLRAALREPHNRDDGMQGPFRVGALDLVTARYALSISPVTCLAVTHLDRLNTLPPRACTAYASAGGRRITELVAPPPDDLNARTRFTEWLRECSPVYTPIPSIQPEQFTRWLGEQLGVPVCIGSFGPTAGDKHLLGPMLSGR
jgi:adenylosuccinate synthase